MVAEIGKPKFDYPHAAFDQELFDDIVANFMDEAAAIYTVPLQQPGLDDLLLELVGDLLQILVHVGVISQILLVPQRQDVRGHSEGP